MARSMIRLEAKLDVGWLIAYLILVPTRSLLDPLLAPSGFLCDRQMINY